MATKRRARPQRPASSLPCAPRVICGDYDVYVTAGGKIGVTCGSCGFAGSYTVHGARRLAATLAGVFGRFETNAPRPERLRLAKLLRERATALEAAR
jgi:hypothetical protein